MNKIITNFKIIGISLFFLATSLQAQELIENKKGWTKQKSILSAGIGTAIPSGKPYYRTTYDYRGATPVTLVGLTASVGASYFLTKHWGFNAEINGDYYLNDHNTAYKNYGATAHKSNWMDAHLLITPFYSIRIKKLVIDLKMTAGVNLIHLGSCSVDNVDSTKSYKQDAINIHGFTFGWGIRGRYALNNNWGCFLSIDNTVDAALYNVPFHNSVGGKSYSNNSWHPEFNYYTIQAGIIFFIRKKNEN